MKRKFSDRANWRRIISKNYSSLFLDEPEFKGYVTIYRIHKLRDPLWKEYNHKRYCLANEGYTWLQHFPAGANFIVTTMFNADHEVIQWYIDICKDQGLTDQGVPWFDDLFLDIIIHPDGEVLLVDEDELEEAYDHGEISKEDYDFALAEASRLLDMIHRDKFPLKQLTVHHLKSLFPAYFTKDGMS